MQTFQNIIDWTTITSNVVVIGLVIWALIKFFSKSFIDTLGEKTAELLTIKQKTKIEETIKSEFATGLETFKSELAKKNMEHQVNYTLYNTERNKACTELYKKFAETHSCLFNVVVIAKAYNSLPDYATSKLDDDYYDSIEKLKKAHSELSSHLIKHKVFIPKTLYPKLDIHVFMLDALTLELSFLFKPTQIFKDDNEKAEIMKGKLEKILTEFNELRKFWNEHQDIFRELMYPEIKE